MFTSNVETIMSMIGPQDKVIDIGGWWKPFVRADWVVDAMPFATRGRGGVQGSGPERFSDATWIQTDVCDRKGLPFEDKTFDFSICSHVLEDIRDPVFLCSEIIRISKAGYIECPSRLVEQCVGVESRNYCGYHHHRWFVEIEGPDVTFVNKSDLPMFNWKLRLPKRFFLDLPEHKRVVWLFWRESFTYREKILTTYEEEAAYLSSLIRSTRAYPEWMYRSVEGCSRLRGGLLPMKASARDRESRTP